MVWQAQHLGALLLPATLGSETTAGVLSAQKYMLPWADVCRLGRQGLSSAQAWGTAPHRALIPCPAGLGVLHWWRQTRNRAGGQVTLKRPT